eukprot:5832060-Amphidinium_carterae.1
MANNQKVSGSILQTVIVTCSHDTQSGSRVGFWKMGMMRAPVLPGVAPPVVPIIPGTSASGTS